MPENDDGVNAPRAENEFQIGSVECAKAGLLEDEIARIDHEPRVEGSRLGAFVEQAVSDLWDQLAQDAHIRAVGAQHMTGMDHENSRPAAHRGKAVDAVQGREPIGRPGDETILQIDIDKRRALGIYREVNHALLPCPSLEALQADTGELLTSFTQRCRPPASNLANRSMVHEGLAELGLRARRRIRSVHGQERADDALVGLGELESAKLLSNRRYPAGWSPSSRRGRVAHGAHREPDPLAPHRSPSGLSENVHANSALVQTLPERLRS